jgi:hypothetical protein
VFNGKVGSRVYFFSLRSTETDWLIFSDEQVDCRSTGHSPPSRRILGSGHRESLLPADESSDLMGLLTGIRIFHFEDTSETAAALQYRRQSRATQ